MQSVYEADRMHVLGCVIIIYERVTGNVYVGEHGETQRGTALDSCPCTLASAQVYEALVWQ